MDGKVDPRGEQFALEFLGEEALAADGPKRRELLVAAGRHRDHFHFHPPRPQLRGDPFGLPLRQHARGVPRRTHAFLGKMDAPNKERMKAAGGRKVRKGEKA